MQSIPQSSRSISDIAHFSSVMSTTGLPVMNQRPMQGARRINPIMCCMQNTEIQTNNPPSRMISAANLNVLPVNPSRFTTQSADLTPAAIVAQPERQITEPLKHKQTFIYGGVETLEAEDCGWLEPIKLKVHAMEVQQYIDPSNPNAKPAFIYNIDHLRECAEIPENWAPVFVTGVPALTFENLNTNPPQVEYPLRLTSENSEVGENNPYIQPIQYHIQRINDVQNTEQNCLSTLSEQEEDDNDRDTKVAAGSFLTSLFNKFKPANRPPKSAETTEIKENDLIEEDIDNSNNKKSNNKKSNNFEETNH